MKLKDIGSKSGKLLVFGGVYSNFQALEALKAYADKAGFTPSQIFCTGDHIAYCAQPTACIEMIQDWGIHAIKGNVELNLVEDGNDCGCNFNEGGRCDLFSKQWFPFAKSKMQQSHLAYISDMPEYIRFEYQGYKVLVLHGTLDDISGYVFESHDWSVKQAILDQADADIILSGHSGLPFYQTASDKHWINAGVIGMPANDGQRNTWFACVDIVKGELQVSYHPLHYDHQEASRLMLHHKLPEPYATTLVTGIWDNCEILPEVESQKQGIKLEF